MSERKILTFTRAGNPILCEIMSELSQRIRDIRSSERNSYQQVTDIYAMSVDYRKGVIS